ncbi:STAS domain-containing protein [Bacillus sp. BGMRC 2118]|nr:STAS domain-containing protein [Bacillus sp. BGMRC 2118]
MNLDVEVKRENQECFVQIKGEIDAYTAPGLKSELVPIAEEKGIQLTLDLSNVSYIDSTGLGVLVGTLKLTRKNDGSMCLIGLNERVTRLFKITGLNEIMDIRG